MSTSTAPAKPESKSGATPAATGATPNPSAGVKTSHKNSAKGKRGDVLRKHVTTNVEVLTPVLTEEQTKELASYEDQIGKNLHTFLETGRALASIRDKKLYVPYPTFEVYVDEKWGFTRQRAYQYIQSSDMVTVLSTRVDTTLLPTTERVAREVLKAKDEYRVRVLELAHQKANGKPTAEDIARARAEVEPAKKKKETAPKKQSVKPEAAIKAAEKLFEFLSNDRLPDMEELDLLKLRLRLNNILEHAQNKKLLEPDAD